MWRLAPVLCALLLTCGHDVRFERQFFEHSRAERVQIMRGYSLEDQYRLLRYGLDVIEPPDLGLVDPIAERGEAAIPFLLSQLKSSSDDLAVRDILQILGSMQYLKTYDVKQYPEFMAALEDRISKMKSQYWQSSCGKRLEHIKNGP